MLLHTTEHLLDVLKHSHAQQGQPLWGYSLSHERGKQSQAATVRLISPPSHGTINLCAVVRLLVPDSVVVGLNCILRRHQGHALYQDHALQTSGSCFA